MQQENHENQHYDNKSYPHDKGYQAYRILQIVFIVAPLLAGLDKFFYIMAEWHRYLSPFAIEFVKGNARSFMMAVGIVEIIVGIGMIFKPQFFSYVVALWLLLIIINLVLMGKYYDMALRDLGLLLSAIALGRLSHKYAHRHTSRV